MGSKSDEEFEIDLPKIRQEGKPVGSVNLSELKTGTFQNMEFEMPETLVTDGFGKHPSVNIESILSQKTYDQMTLKFLGYDVPEDDPRMVMFGDYSEIELLMKNVTTDGGLQKLLLRPGTGKAVENKNMVKMHYLMGAEPLDDLVESTYENRYYKRFRVGVGEVISAIDIGISTMRTGEIAKFLASSDYGYGKLGFPLLGGTGIPGESRIMIQIEVIETYTTGSDDSILHMSPSERETLPFYKLLLFANNTKKEGNQDFQDEQYKKACSSYLEALEIIRDMDPITPEEKNDYFKLRHQLCNNLSNVYFKMERFNRALKYAEEGIGIPIDGLLKAKSHFWCAKALFALGRYELCYQHVERAEFLRNDDSVKQFKLQVVKKLCDVKKQEKEFCFRIMGTRLQDSGK